MTQEQASSLSELSSLRLKRAIMTRVYSVWFWKSIAPMLAVEFVLLAVVAIGVLTHISLRHIFLNALTASSGIRDFVQFFINNFFVKSVQSQLLLGMYAVVGAFFIRDLRRAVRRLKTFQSANALAQASFASHR